MCSTDAWRSLTDRERGVFDPLFETVHVPTGKGVLGRPVGDTEYEVVAVRVESYRTDGFQVSTWEVSGGGRFKTRNRLRTQ